jgi:hypothetical protein
MQISSLADAQYTAPSTFVIELHGEFDLADRHRVTDAF